MNKRKRMIIAIIVMVIQLLAPVILLATMGVSEYSIEKNGEIFTFEVNNFHFSNGLIKLNLSTMGEWICTSDKVKYLIIETDENGNTVFDASSEKPEHTSYIDRTIAIRKNYGFPYALYVDVTPYENLENVVLVKQVDGASLEPLGNWILYRNVTADLIVYKGRFMVHKVYIDGVEIEDYLLKLNEYYS